MSLNCFRFAWLRYGEGNTLTQIGLFFSRAAVVTFGGAYAVLAYIAQEAVQTYGWLQPGEIWASLLIAAAAFIALFRFKVSMLWTLAGAAAAGLLYYLLFMG